MLAVVVSLALSMCPPLAGWSGPRITPPNRPVPVDISPDPVPTKPPQE